VSCVTPVLPRFIERASALSALCVAVLIPSISSAQATLAAIVKDSSGAVLPGVAVGGWTATSPTGRLYLKTEADQDSPDELPFLPQCR
jgi:hypothetical protein